MGTIVKQELDPPSNALTQARARMVCFREVALPHAPASAGAERRPPPRARLLLVTYDDGAYGILLNGRPIPGSPWPEHQLDHCIEVFQNVGRCEAPPAAGPDGTKARFCSTNLGPRPDRADTARRFAADHPRDSTRISAPTSTSPASTTRQ